MMSFYNVYLILFVVTHTTLLNGIVIKSKSHLHSTISPPTYLDLLKSVNVDNILKAMPFNETTIKNHQSNQFLKYTGQNSISSSPSLLTSLTQHAVHNASKNIIKRISLSNGKIISKNENLKPIYETENQSDLLIDQDFPGYFYKPSTFSNIQMLKDETIKVKDSYTPQDLTTAIMALDQLLKPLLNGESYNSGVHPPTNPVLSLILSRYGKYISGSPNPNVYSYMAVNNIHNNRPFGQYKYGYDEDHFYK